MSQNVPSGPSTWNGGLTNISISFEFRQIRFNNNTGHQLSFDVNDGPSYRLAAYIMLTSSIDAKDATMPFVFEYKSGSSSIVDNPILATGVSTRLGGSAQSTSSMSINIGVDDDLELSINGAIGMLKNLPPFIRITNSNYYVKSFAVSYAPSVGMIINGNAGSGYGPSSSSASGYYGIDRDSTYQLAGSRSYVGLWPTTLSYNLEADVDYPIIIPNSKLKQYFKPGITNEIKIVYGMGQIFLYNS